MHAVRLHAFGPPENLIHEEVSDPVPGDGQVRIRVEAAGVHLIDSAIRRGVTWRPARLPDLPTVPGREVAGTVDATGPSVDDRWVGHRVVAHLRETGGGYAELAVSAAEASTRSPTSGRTRPWR